VTGKYGSMEVWGCGGEFSSPFSDGKTGSKVTWIDSLKQKTPLLRGFLSGQKRWSFRDWLRKVIQELGMNSIK
jgi:hypothetical protein